MKRVRCINVDETAGVLQLGATYDVIGEQNDSDTPRYELRDIPGWYYQSRFVDGDDVATPARDTEPMFSATPAVVAETSFDFEHYNSLSALPGGRR